MKVCLLSPLPGLDPACGDAAVLELFGAHGDGTWFGMATRLGQPYRTLHCRAVGDNVVVDLEALKRRVETLGAGHPAPKALAHV